MKIESGNDTSASIIHEGNVIIDSLSTDKCS